MEDTKKNRGAGLKQLSEERPIDSDETAYLLRSPRNAVRLLAALHEAELGSGYAESIGDLRRSAGLFFADVGRS